MRAFNRHPAVLKHAALLKYERFLLQDVTGQVKRGTRQYLFATDSAEAASENNA